VSEVSGTVAFFDIGNTLASVRVSPTENRIEEITVFPDVPPVLEELRSTGVRLGILSSIGTVPEENVNEALANSGLFSYFDRNLVLYGPKDSPRLFEQAAARVLHAVEGNDETPRTTLFVGEDSVERAQARAGDFLVAPHPRLALSVLRQEGPLRFLRIRLPPASAATDWRGTLRSLPLVPLHVSAEPGGAPAVAVYAVADTATASTLDDLGFWVDRLGAEDEPLATDLYILRDDQQMESGFLRSVGNSADHFNGPRSARRILASSHEGLLVAIPAGRSVESYHFQGARHGHNLKLVASMGLLEPTELGDSQRLANTVAATPDLLSVAAFEDDEAALAPALSVEETRAFKKHITAKLLGRDVERYSGVRAVGGTTKILSRHIHHADNVEAVRALIQDLMHLTDDLSVRTHRFIHEGRRYDNVEAKLPSRGLDGIILVTAHMDSTGARKAGYRSSIDPAGGADDDASGMAGVLSAARALIALNESLDIQRREIRFVLFNAEEHGLVGSRAYAREQASLGANIIAIFQMDMIGHDIAVGRNFELHAGFTPSRTVQARSDRLASLISCLCPLVSPALPAPQRYPGPNGSSDPAEGRSDHYSFQLEGYAACLVSEDFFAGPGPASPAPDPNPNYHLPEDMVINAPYAADIARAIAAAAWVAATR
jgi:bacterial leucyl aminopeptidase